MDICVAPNAIVMGIAFKVRTRLGSHEWRAAQREAVVGGAEAAKRERELY